MKNFYHALCAIFAFVVAFTMGACTEPEIEAGATNYSVVVSMPTPMGAEIDVTVKDIKEFAYFQSNDNLPAAAILKAGKVVTVENPATTTTKRVVIDGLKPNTAYTYLFAFMGADGTVISNVKKVKFTTTNYGETLTIVERKYNGVAIQVNIPAEVKAAGNGLRYALASMPMYNYAKIQEKIEPGMLLNNAQQFTTTDKLVIYDEEHNYEFDENGNILENGAEYADPQVPGEPGYFLIGEYEYMDDTEARLVYVDGETKWVNDESYWDSTIWTYPAGWDAGYYNPKYDWVKFMQEYGTPAYDSEKYWTGYYERIAIHTLEPEIVGNVDITVSELTPIDACITFNASEEIENYNIMLCTETEYQNEILPLIEGKEEYLRWFTGSYFAMFSFNQVMGSGKSELWVSDWFIDTKGLAGQTIRVLVAGLGNDEGTKQCFNTYSFEMPEVTLPKPQVKVTPVETGDPYNFTFNIKNITPDNPITEAYFACNYVREFDAILKEYTYTSLLKSMGNAFTKNDIAKINSADGFDFTMSSLEASTSRLAVLVYNWEGSGNNPDEKDSPAVAEITTPTAKYPVRVEHELFSKLPGKWVATAPMATVTALTDDEGYPTGEYKYEDAGTYTSDVTIFDEKGLPYSETIPQEVLDIYTNAGMSRGEIEDLYADLGTWTEWYNNRTRGHNRLLCYGFNFAEAAYMLGNTATPYDLFTASNYSASKVEYMFYDFGPKWNLEIDEDGSVWLPINYEREYPLSAWNFSLDYAFYLMGIHDGTAIAKDIRFPVEVSADYNTITIKPYVLDEEVYYPTIAIIQSGSISTLNPRIQGDVVLKRQGTTPAAVKANVACGKAATPARLANGEVVAPKTISQYSMTPMDPEKITPVTRIAPKKKIEAGSEAYHERASKCVRKYFGLE